MRSTVFVHSAVWALIILTVIQAAATAHDHSLRGFQARRAIASSQSAQKAEPAPATSQASESCRLTVSIDAGSRDQLVPALVRVINLASGKAIAFSGEISRDANWYALDGMGTTLLVPRGRIRIEACRGLDSYISSHELDLSDKREHALRMRLESFYDPLAAGLRAGNTHLHLMRMTRDEAERYLRVVPQADKLDLVYLSHLRRVPDERVYISNEFSDADLYRLSRKSALFGNGQEHRHNFGPQAEGFGHVMFLDILRLIQPVSIGPGIMKEGTDGIPLQRGIKSARSDGAAVIWCHNTFGFEDVPNWVAGLVDAQNIFDGGDHGTYEDTFYRYLNLGLKVPFSTGTDWFIYDFSRVYVPLSGELTSKKWLAELAASRSYITNGPFLELTVNGRPIGDTIQSKSGDKLQVKCRGLGRVDFGGLELVSNGQVIAKSPSQAVVSKRMQRHFECGLETSFDVAEPGWLALRIATRTAKNEFEKPLFAHTSPVYIEMDGRRIFQTNVAKELVREMEESMRTIVMKGHFADEPERETVLRVYREGIESVREWIAAGRKVK